MTSRTAGPTAISISGGGLRSASFALGALQALQSGRGLLFGERAAEYLSAVSGGSFIAASATLEAARQSVEGASRVAPLASGSPEEQHILTHADYLAHHRWRFVALAGANLLSFIVLFVWLGFLIADLALIALLAVHWLGLDWRLESFPAALVIPVSVASIYLLLFALYSQSRWRRTGLSLFAFVLAFFSWPASFGSLASAPVLQSKAESLAVVGLLLVVIGATTYVSVTAMKRGVDGRTATWLNRVTVWAPRAFGFYLLAWIAVNWYAALKPVLNDNADQQTEVIVGIATFATLFGTLLFSNVPHRASLHREVRDRVATCFAVRRRGDGIELVGDCSLAGLAPPAGGAGRFPKLIVAATANTRVPSQPDGQSSPVGSFLFGTDRCGIPEAPGTGFATRQLELLREPAGFFSRRQEPLVSLMSAVACSGAAVSPGMGRATLPSARMVIAAVGIRLGRWIPNQMNAPVRKQVEALHSPGKLKHDTRMGDGYDELIPEMIGMTGERIYVSDGGHYDNLGLLPLLRARCTEIWCLDAPPEPRGEARELRRIIQVANDALGVRITIDLGVFAADSEGRYGETHAIGSIVYPDGPQGTLIVIKLGLSPDTPPNVADYRSMDSGFPHHPTTQQVYTSARMNAYRLLGNDSASRALRAVGTTWSA